MYILLVMTSFRRPLRNLVFLLIFLLCVLFTLFRLPRRKSFRIGVSKDLVNPMFPVCVSFFGKVFLLTHHTPMRCSYPLVCWMCSHLPFPSWVVFPHFSSSSLLVCNRIYFLYYLFVIYILCLIYLYAAVWSSRSGRDCSLNFPIIQDRNAGLNSTSVWGESQLWQDLSVMVGAGTPVPTHKDSITVSATLQTHGCKCVVIAQLRIA